MGLKGDKNLATANFTTTTLSAVNVNFTGNLLLKSHNVLDELLKLIQQNNELSKRLKELEDKVETFEAEAE